MATLDRATSNEANQVDQQQLDTVLAGTRAVGAIIAESMASVETVVSMPQLRVLILADRERLGVTAVAEDLGVHPSNATRTCDRLVNAGLLKRETSETDRRRVELSLTPSGKKLLDRVMQHRRRRVEEVMARMSPEERADLASSLAAFAEMAGTEGPGPHPIPARHG